MKKYRIVFNTALVMFLLHPLALLAAPQISIDAETGTLTVDPQGASASEVLQALADKAGFTLSGKLEAPTMPLNHSMHNNLEYIINRLVSSQSTVVIYGTNEKGGKYISKVELLPTGNEDTKFIELAEDGARPLTGSQEKIEKTIKHNERRALNRARRIEDGTLVWTPEGQKYLREKMEPSN